MSDSKNTDLGQLDKSPRRVGVRRIAELAGVSTATVSRAFNSPEKVRAEIRQRIEDAAAQINYVPNSAAKALSLSRNFRIGAAIPTIDNAIYARFIEALDDTLMASGYALSLGMHENNKDREFEVVRSLIASGVDGMILTGNERLQKTWDLLGASNIAFVLTSVDDIGLGHCTVGYDNAQGGYMAAEHLLNLGHRRFGIIAGEIEINDRSRLRMKGIEDALTEWGIKVPMAATKYRGITLRNGRNALKEILAAEPEITAVICASDVLAAGAVFEAQASGRRVPEDLSITGFDGTDLASEIEPTLATVAVPCDNMGQRAAKTVLAKIADPKFRANICLDLILVEGRSTTGPA